MTRKETSHSGDGTLSSEWGLGFGNFLPRWMNKMDSLVMHLLAKLTLFRQPYNVRRLRFLPEFGNRWFVSLPFWGLRGEIREGSG